MSKFYYIQTSDNYADEFDVDGFCVLTEKDYLECKARTEKALEEHFKVSADKKNRYGRGGEYEYYFGTNEQLLWSSASEYWSVIKVKEIQEDQYKTIKEVIGSYYGTCFFPLDY